MGIFLYTWVYFACEFRGGVKYKQASSIVVSWHMKNLKFFCLLLPDLGIFVKYDMKREVMRGNVQNLRSRLGRLARSERVEWNRYCEQRVLGFGK